MRRRLVTFIAGAAFAAPAPFAVPAAHAQDLARHIEAAQPDASIGFTFAARPDVCGTGDNAWIMDSGGRPGTVHAGGTQWAATSPDRLEACERGPVFVELQRRHARITDITVRVGSPPARPGADWLTVTPGMAADYLLAESSLMQADADVARRMVLAAVLADTVTWPRLLELARARTVADGTRRAAIFWLGQAAGDRVVEGLHAVISDDADDLRVRESAVFALSRMKDDASTTALIEIARTHSDPRIRRSAMFWLAQSGSPRAVAFFEDVLRGGG